LKLSYKYFCTPDKTFSNPCDNFRDQRLSSFKNVVSQRKRTFYYVICRFINVSFTILPVTWISLIVITFCRRHETVGGELLNNSDIVAKFFRWSLDVEPWHLQHVKSPTCHGRILRVADGRWTWFSVSCSVKFGTFWSREFIVRSQASHARYRSSNRRRLNHLCNRIFELFSFGFPWTRTRLSETIPLFPHFPVVLWITINVINCDFFLYRTSVVRRTYSKSKRV